MSSDVHNHVNTLTLDQLFEILSRQPRRQILDALHEESPRDIHELTDEEFRSEREAEFVELTLRHNHLPRLDETGIVRWDERNGTIRTGPQFEKVRPFLELVCDNQDTLPVSWP